MYVGIAFQVRRSRLRLILFDFVSQKLTGERILQPSMQSLFGSLHVSTKVKYSRRRRGSSANWTKDGLTLGEVRKCKTRLGQTAVPQVEKDGNEDYFAGGDGFEYNYKCNN